MDQSHLLKQLTNGKQPKKAISIPGLAYIQSALKKVKSRQVFDAALFGLSVFVIYSFGKNASNMLEDQIPSEQ